ncbi:MAG: ROK family protein [Chthoniobacteraceae bacterium]|jgi:predicted NBD/HSP70 family sugar kinase
MMNQRNPAPEGPQRILIIDAGGSHIKLILTGMKDRVKFQSGRSFTPRQLIAGIRKHTAGWDFDAVSLGLPIPIVNNKPVREPNNLGRGWLRFDFPAAFGKPVKLINDAAMQALGSYEGGRMLFIGLGTGLGSAMILDNIVIPLELSEMTYAPRRTFEHMVGREGRKRLGDKKWEAAVHHIVAVLRAAFVTDYIVIGGGNARRLERLPKGARLGNNRNAFLGGLRLWGQSPGPTGAKSRTLVIC